MGLRFRRSIKLFPGLRLNLTTRGVSATIGPRGANVSAGPRGTYANVGIPGTGLSARERLDGPPSDGQAPTGSTAPARRSTIAPWLVLLVIIAFVLWALL